MVTTDLETFTAVDDGLHEPSADRWETETFWFSFFNWERSLGGWIYASVRPNIGTLSGGAWIWDPTGVDPWEVPFYEQFTGLRPPTTRGPQRMEFASGMTVTTREPLHAYDLTYDDRKRLQLALTFDAHCPPQPLRSGAPPYPKAHHFDQTGRVHGTITLDGEAIEIDCYAMRDRSWGPRNERGYGRVGYTWAADADSAFLTYTNATGISAGPERVYAGYHLRDGKAVRVVDGERRVARDPGEGWVTAIEIDAVDDDGRAFAARGRARSRLVLPHATAICVCSVMDWELDGVAVGGEDQDVWPIAGWRAARMATGLHG